MESKIQLIRKQSKHNLLRVKRKMSNKIWDILKLQERKVEIVPILANELTQEQITDFENAFSLFDGDNDGRITIHELTMVMKALGQTPSSKEVNDMIASVDCDHNGSIEFPEFLILMANKLDREDLSGEVEKAFRVFDKDNDGYVKRCEIQDMLENFGEKMTFDEIEEFLAIADKNGDGIIDYGEFASQLQLGSLS